MKKILATLALLTVIATPAFAQDYIDSNGTGNVLPFAYATTQNTRTTSQAQAEQAYASAPIERNVNQDVDSPANTGGGSEGYNSELSNVQP
jgi:opacity protein-like surface antigen